MVLYDAANATLLERSMLIKSLGNKSLNNPLVVTTASTLGLSFKAGNPLDARTAFKSESKVESGVAIILSTFPVLVHVGSTPNILKMNEAIVPSSLAVSTHHTTAAIFSGILLS